MILSMLCICWFDWLQVFFLILLLLWQWLPRDGIITHATYSCDSQMIFASFMDGSVSVFTAALQLRCRISPAAYLNAQSRYLSAYWRVVEWMYTCLLGFSELFNCVVFSASAYPLVIAAHPSDPSQFSLGLTDGSVQVLEPLESEGKWGTAPPPENGVGLSASSTQAVGNSAPDQSSRWW